MLESMPIQMRMTRGSSPSSFSDKFFTVIVGENLTKIVTQKSTEN